jgi:hypothetical protein
MRSLKSEHLHFPPHRPNPPPRISLFAPSSSPRSYAPPDTNWQVIRGALRAERPELLTVVLPQSMSKQPQESQDLLAQVANVIQMPQNDSMALIDASRCGLSNHDDAHPYVGLQL